MSILASHTTDTQELGSRKRRRSDVTAEDPDATTSTICVALDDEPIVRDATYYREDGDCVIQVGGVLFKIHRFLLERDSSAFSNMFSMPQGSANSHVSTDENPLVLYDDPDDFRALCWIIYALPKVYMKQFCSSSPDVEKLVSLYLIAHKYHFESHESLARHLIGRHCAISHNGTPHSSPTQAYFTKCSESRFQTVLRIATLTESTAPYKESFPYALQRMWTYRLKLTKESISYALDVGESLGLRNFVAELYYLELTRMKPVPVENSGAYALPVNDDLAPHQKLALYQGNWTLRYYWSKTREEAPKTAISCSLPTHHCHQVWKRSWERCKLRELTAKSFDPWKELTNVAKEINAIIEQEELAASCAVIAINDLITDLKNNIAIHFLGPLPPIPDSDLSS